MNKLIFILIIIILILPLFGCLKNTKDNTEITDDGIKITKSFGSFIIPEDWTEITRYSRGGKYFYSHKSEQVGPSMTNISIELGRNRYALEDHMTFRYAILRQLSMQGGAGTLAASGDYTKQNDPLYIFSFEDIEPQITTIQFYIVGNYRYILVHATDFHNGNINDVKAVAQFIVDSFIWAD